MTGHCDTSIMSEETTNGNEMVMKLQISVTADGVWMLHESTQRPVEGFAVYRYATSYDCEKCGRAGGLCQHIKSVMDKEKDEGR